MAAILSNLDPIFLPQVNGFVAELVRQKIPCCVAETERNYSKQADCFKKGFSKCDGLKNISLHQARLAVDVVALDAEGNRTWDYVEYASVYRQIADIAKTFNMDSGANWPPINPKTGLGWDPPHHQFKG
jgi:hypothetical protein